MLECRGTVSLANFYPSRGTEAGRVRLCLVIQVDALNSSDHASTMVIPLTTQLTPEAAPLRLRIIARKQLRQDSDLTIDQVRAIDNRRFTGDVLATLTNEELLKASAYLKILLEL
jgi:mRNA interferase MazF